MSGDAPDAKETQREQQHIKLKLNDNKRNWSRDPTNSQFPNIYHMTYLDVARSARNSIDQIASLASQGFAISALFGANSIVTLSGFVCHAGTVPICANMGQVRKLKTMVGEDCPAGLSFDIFDGG